jgi:hypothetical protein
MGKSLENFESFVEFFEVLGLHFLCFPWIEKSCSKFDPKVPSIPSKYCHRFKPPAHFKINLQKSIHYFPLNKTLPINFHKSDLHAELQLKLSD